MAIGSQLPWSVPRKMPSSSVGSTPRRPGDAVLAVAREGHVLRLQRPAGADLRGLLAEQRHPDAELALALQRVGLPVDPADQHHVAVERLQRRHVDVGDVAVEVAGSATRSPSGVSSWTRSAPPSSVARSPAITCSRVWARAGGATDVGGVQSCGTDTVPPRAHGPATVRGGAGRAGRRAAPPGWGRSRARRSAPSWHGRPAGGTVGTGRRSGRKRGPGASAPDARTARRRVGTCPFGVDGRSALGSRGGLARLRGRPGAAAAGTTVAGTTAAGATAAACGAGVVRGRAEAGVLVVALRAPVARRSRSPVSSGCRPPPSPSGRRRRSGSVLALRLLVDELGRLVEVLAGLVRVLLGVAAGGLGGGGERREPSHHGHSVLRRLVFSTPRNVVAVGRVPLCTQRRPASARDIAADHARHVTQW